MALVGLSFTVMAVALGLIASLGRDTGPSDPRPMPANATHAPLPAADDRNEELDALRKQLAALSQAVAKLALEQRAAPPIPDGPQASEEPLVEEEIVPPQAPDFDLEAQLEDARLARRALEERLDAESFDARGSAWAAAEIEHELELREFDRTHLQASECSTTLCRLEFAFEDEAARDRAIGELPFLLPTQGGGDWFVDPAAPLEIVFFANRDDDPS